tara:strand:- start:983 stop:1189 length:207 start_codon:yes stop_codon:yes gene_type:complete
MSKFVSDLFKSVWAIHINFKVIFDNQSFLLRDFFHDPLDLLLEMNEFGLFYLNKINCESTTERITCLF